MSSSRPPGCRGQWHARRGPGGGRGGSPSVPTPISSPTEPTTRRALSRLRSALQHGAHRVPLLASSARPGMPSVPAPGVLRTRLDLNTHPLPGRGSVSLFAGAKTGSEELIKSLAQSHTARKLAQPKSTQICLVAKVFAGHLTGAGLTGASFFTCSRGVQITPRLWVGKAEDVWVQRERRCPGPQGGAQVLQRSVQAFRSRVCLRAKRARGGLRGQARGEGAHAGVR